MTKKNNHHNWRQAREEELGFTNIPSNFEQGDSNATGDPHKNPLINPWQQRSDQVENLTTENVKTEVKANRIQANDVLYISPNENPGMFLTADLFDGQNFHVWYRAIRRGLGSRNKLKIIDGSMHPPPVDSIDYMQFLKVDYLIFNWISNSMNKEIARGFQHLDTSAQLWVELHKRFGKRNGSRIYQVMREIATYSQNGQNVMMYFNSLTSLWDNLALLRTQKDCTCEATEDAKTNLEEEHLMQFLMGLEDCYETIRQQILIMHPLPNVSQAYAMVLQVEEQINVSNKLSSSVGQSAMYSAQKSFGGERYRRRLSKEEKEKLRCDHCGGKRHLKTECFDIVG